MAQCERSEVSATPPQSSSKSLMKDACSIVDRALYETANSPTFFGSTSNFPNESNNLQYRTASVPAGFTDTTSGVGPAAAETIALVRLPTATESSEPAIDAEEVGVAGLDVGATVEATVANRGTDLPACL